MPEHFAETSTAPDISDTVAERFPAAVTGRLVMEGRLWLEVMCAALGRRRPSQTLAAALGSGMRFPLHKGSVSSIILPLAVITSCVDIPLIHLLLNGHVSPVMRGPFHAALLAVNVWTLVWIFGDRSAICRIPHVIGPAMLRLRVGFRVAVEIPLTAVRSVQTVKGSPGHWMQAKGLSRRDVMLVTPMDEPNVLIEISGALDAVRALRAGRPTAGRRFLAIRVDDNEGFRRALAMSAHE